MGTRNLPARWGRTRLLAVLFVGLALLVFPRWVAADNVVTYHNANSRSGSYVVPNLTFDAAKNLQLDTGFHASVPGHVYAQPLFWHPAGGRALLIIATESNAVVALDATTGSIVWQVTLGIPARLRDFGCGDVDPEGITATPVIDPNRGVIYLNAVIKAAERKVPPKQFVYALSLTNGSIVPGWPLDVEAQLAQKGVRFSSTTQRDRGALTLFQGALFVSFGSRWDCGDYRGTVLQIRTANPTIENYWQARARGGGIWSQGGLSADATSLFASTGNTFGVSSWSDGEGIIRLRPGLRRSEDTRDFFAPGNWRSLDDDDLDLGAAGALPFDLRLPNGNAATRVIAFGKDGNAYLADRKNLGGIGGGIATLRVSKHMILTSPAIYEAQDIALVAFTNAGSEHCSGSHLQLIKVVANGNSQISNLWCSRVDVADGQGGPIFTTTDGISNPIVWLTGAEGDDLLHGFNALTGEVLFTGGKVKMSGLRHFGTLIAAEGRLYVGADNTVFAFAPK